MIDYTLILKKRYPQAQWTLDGDNYEGLVWLSDEEKPSEQELISHWDSVLQQLKEEKIEAASKRQALLERLGITAEEAKLLLS